MSPDKFMSTTNAGRNAVLRVAKTTAQRVTETKQRKRERGLVEVRSLWVYPPDIPAIRALAAELRAARVMGAKS